MFTKSDEPRRRQILSGFVQKGCGNSSGTEEKQSTEEKSPAEVEREKEQNKK